MRKKYFLIFLIFLNVFLYAEDTTQDASSDYNLLIEDQEGLDIIGLTCKVNNEQTITKEDIEMINAKDLTEALEKAANISITRYGSYGSISSVNIRGMSQNRVLILLNGVPMNSSQTGGVDLGSIPVGMIKKIEIVKGGSDTTYNLSGAVGGVINIITETDLKKDTVGFFFDANNLFYYPNYYYVSGDSTKYYSEARDFFDTQNIKTGFFIGNNVVTWNLSCEGAYVNNGYIYKDLKSNNRKMENNEIWEISPKTSLNFNLPNYMKILTTGYYYHSDNNVPGSLTAMNLSKQIDDNCFFSIKYDADMVGIDKIDTEVTFSYKMNNNAWIENYSRDSHMLHTIFTSNRWNFLPLNWLKIVIGGDFQFDYLLSSSIGEKYQISGGGFVTVEFDIKKIISIVPSIKIVYYKNYPIPVPKIGFAAILGKYFTFRNNFYGNYRIPTLNDLYWKEDAYAVGNQNLKYEIGAGGDISLEFYKKGYLRASSSIYVNWIKDLILWHSDGGKWKPSNVGQALIIGSENYIETDFSKYFSMNIAYNYTKTFCVNDVYDYADDKRIPYTPEHSFSFGVKVNWISGSITMNGIYESLKYTTIVNFSKIDPYFKIDISINQKLNKYLEIYSVFNNIFNTSYFLMENYPLPGGSITVGLKVNYETNPSFGGKK